ncbi:GNAT family N-acetyltransferase [Chamaesiphon sp. GL140_3_metabinner_50]|uniref:GNAT family N-acetyltransferase n=1 Tax=Chamaesiphon sp. GL140_3_metabinner_50 TaxID=2970812 RepID=UPI0025E51889|nr:GNAT family N-acetyltransferase [Chamaesiphon sp. GL140_3_metabinner_50]
MEVSIRLAKTADLEAIIDLQTKSLSNLPDRSRKYDSQQIESLIAGQAAMTRIYFSSGTTLIAEDNDRIPVGFICFAKPHIFAQPQIAGLYVHPEFMNKGIGGKLLTELERLAISGKIETLVVMSSIESSDFYKKNSYQFKRETGFFSQGSVWIPCELLEKELIPCLPTQKLATQTVKIILSVVFLAIIATVTNKAENNPICCPASSCRVCPQTIRP